MTTETLIEDHELAALFPLMSGEAFEELVDDIREHGLMEPIVLYEGKILDGRNRYRAAQLANVSVQFVDYDGDAPLAYVVSHNLKRRHLTLEERAEIGRKLLPEFKEEAERRQRAGGDRGRDVRYGNLAPDPWIMSQKSDTSISHTARADAGAAVGVSGGTIERLRRVAEQAPDLHEKVKAGEMSIRAADDELSARKGTAPPKEPRHQASKPFEINGSQKKQWDANKAYERFGTVMGGIAGYRDGLVSFDIRRVLAVARPDEIDEWVRTLSEFISVARKVQASLKEGN